MHFGLTTYRVFLALCLLIITNYKSQKYVNYVTNGSFEKIIDCGGSFLEYKSIGWTGVDSVKSVAFLYNTVCGNVPHTGVGYQMPKEGSGYIRLQFLLIGGGNFSRSNLKNRLKSTLVPGKIYCVKMYVNTQDSCALAIDSFGFYFGDSSIDTIKYNARFPLTFLSPQINNPSGNFINDTMNWIPVTGTFVASGVEKYMIIGNFRTDIATSTVSTGVVISPNYIFSEYFVDAVSCIEMNVPAYAGPDQWIIPGDSAFIGREPDFAVDPYCVWYKLPNTAVPIYTTAGFWAKPVNTTTYVVRQELECGSVSWDTVVVYPNPLGITELKILNEDLKIYPQPAGDYLELRITNNELLENYRTIIIYNNIGQIVREAKVTFRENIIRINTADLADGVYSLRLRNEKSASINKKFVISR